MMGEVRGEGPLSEVGRGINANDELLSKGENHDPPLSWGVPDDFGIAELSGVHTEDGVVLISGKGVSQVGGVGNILRLFSGGVQGEDGNDTISLIGEESRSVVGINNDRSGEDVLLGGLREDGDGLVCPAIQIPRRCMTPMLIAGHDVRRIVCLATSVTHDVGAIAMDKAHIDNKDAKPR